MSRRAPMADEAALAADARLEPGESGDLRGIWTRELRWLLGITLVVSLALATGVYWLHHVTAGPDTQTTASIIQVHLIPLKDQADLRREDSGEPHKNALASKSEPLIQDPHRTILKDEEAAREESGSQEDMATPPADPAAAPANAARASVAAPVEMTPSRTALLFQQELLSHIAHFRHYPSQAKRERREGTVQLLFAMRRNGIVTGVWVRTSSGSEMLDNAAIDTIRRAQPLPRIPSELPDRLNITIPVIFALPRGGE